MILRPFPNEIEDNYTSINNISFYQTGFNAYFEFVHYNDEDGFAEYLEVENPETRQYFTIKFAQMKQNYWNDPKKFWSYEFFEPERCTLEHF